jgi:DNA-binding NtrC family response regulator
MGLKLLVAEDEVNLYRAIVRTIKRRVPTVELTHVTCGNHLKEEIDKIVKGTVEYNVILSDNDLDDGHDQGLYCLKYAKDLGLSQPYLMMSGRDIRKKALDLGAKEFFEKPMEVLEIGKYLKDNFWE